MKAACPAQQYPVYPTSSHLLTAATRGLRWGRELIGVTFHGPGGHREWVAFAGENGDPNAGCEGWGDSPFEALSDLVRRFREDGFVGEEIDNSFVLDGDTYLLEAKWVAGKTEAAELYAFRQKVSSKSAYTRGLQGAPQRP